MDHWEKANPHPKAHRAGDEQYPIRKIADDRIKIS